MAVLSIKDVPELWAEALRQRAARHHRSLQGELMAIIEAALVSAGTVAQESYREVAVAQSKDVQIGRDAEQVARALAAKYAEPVADVPLGVDIIRLERDSR